MFLISIVYSDGLYNGREVVPVFGQNKDEVIKEAYEYYDSDYDQAKADGSLDESSKKLTFDEFREQMELGFDNGQDFIHIQCDEYHIQYEPK